MSLASRSSSPYVGAVPHSAKAAGVKECEKAHFDLPLSIVAISVIVCCIGAGGLGAWIASRLVG